MTEEFCLDSILEEINKKKPLWTLGLHQERKDDDDKNIYSFKQYIAKIAGFTLELERKYDKFWSFLREEPEYNYRLKVKVNDTVVAKFYGCGKLAFLFETCNKDQ